MRRIPDKQKRQIDADIWYRSCARWKEGGCSGRITIEHVYTYANRQIAEMWNYIPLCVWHHLRDGLDKELNKAIALSRATDEELMKYPKMSPSWQQQRIYYSNKYPEYYVRS